MGDLTEGLELRCSRCRAVVDACSICGGALNVGDVRCARDSHHHEHCDDERRRRVTSAIHARETLPAPASRP